MGASYIQVAADGSGKKMQTVQNTVGSDVVHAEAVYLVDSTGATVSVTSQRTCASSVASTNGSVSAGAQSVQFVPSSDFTGTLLGAAWPGTNAAIGFSANGRDTLGAIAYTVSAGSVTILTIT